MIEVPSGRNLKDYDMGILRDMRTCRFVEWFDDPFLLTSGIPSHVYVMGRERLTDNGLFEKTVGTKVAHAVWWNKTKHPMDRIPCLIGVPTAATSIAQAAAMASLWLHDPDQVIAHRLMREVKEGNKPTRGWVDGKPDHERHTYWLVEQAVTTGHRMKLAAERLREDGYPVPAMPALVFVDRQEGGVAQLREMNLFREIEVVYYLLDIIYVFTELGYWPKERVRIFEEEIQAHQGLASERRAAGE